MAAGGGKGRDRLTEERWGLFCCVAWWRPALMERPICVQLREGRGWLKGISLVLEGKALCASDPRGEERV